MADLLLGRPAAAVFLPGGRRMAARASAQGRLVDRVRRRWRSLPDEVLRALARQAIVPCSSLGLQLSLHFGPDDLLERTCFDGDRAKRLALVVSRLRDGRWYVQLAAIHAIRQIGADAPAVADELARRLTDASAAVRSSRLRALVELGSLKGDALRHAVARACQDPTVSVRLAALGVVRARVGREGPAQWTPADADGWFSLIERLHPMLSDDHAAVRAAATEAIADIAMATTHRS